MLSGLEVAAALTVAHLRHDFFETQTLLVQDSSIAEVWLSLLLFCGEGQLTVVGLDQVVGLEEGAMLLF